MPTAVELFKNMGGKWIKGDKHTIIHGIMSRYNKVKPGYLYFDFDIDQMGNQNIIKAVENGATAVVFSKNKMVPRIQNPSVVLISVPNVFTAFWKTIKYYRNMHNIPTVAVTGTSGKTTTISMIASIFSIKWKTFMTPKNLNLPEYLPKHIMDLNKGFKAAVFEVGMYMPGQIRSQSKIIEPKVGVITNIGAGHLEHLGSVKNVILEKSGIMAGIPKDGCLVLNKDDPGTKQIDLSQFKGKVIYYGLVNKADYMAFGVENKENGTSFTGLIDGKSYPFFIPTYGTHNIYNAIAAIAVARFFNIDIDTIQKGLAKFSKPKKRLQIVDGIKNCKLIDDTYNANPDSVVAGLKVLKELANSKTTVAVLGNMLEQGKYTIENHRKVGKKVEELKVDWLITVGKQAKEIAKGCKSNRIKTWSFDFNMEAIHFLQKNLPENSIVLIKGSRGAHMENIVQCLKKPFVLSIPTVAITGSAGKTTTKDMIASVLGEKLNVLKSVKNMNEIYHTKMNVNRIRPGHQAVVLEFAMGTKNAGIMHCSYIQPNIGVITNIGTAHYGNLGNSLKSIAESKSALIRYMKPDGILLINNDDVNSKLLQTKDYKGKIITVGIHKKANYQARAVKLLDNGMQFELVLDGKTEKFFVPALGYSNVINALFAVAIGHHLNLSPSEIKSGLKNFKLPDRRLNLLKLRNNSLLIDDTYNSSPEAVKAAVDVLAELGKGKKKIAVLGSMLSLGQYTIKGHQDIGRYLAEKNIDMICTYGKDAKLICSGAVSAGHKHIKHFLDRNQLNAWLKQTIKPSTVILVKGSNALNMNETVEYLKQEFS